jgi:hypothetical protein
VAQIVNGAIGITVSSLPQHVVAPLTAVRKKRKLESYHAANIQKQTDLTPIILLPVSANRVYIVNLAKRNKKA